MVAPAARRFVVVGGGIVGASTAFFLSRLAPGRVTLLEKLSAAGESTSWGNAGLHSPSIVTPHQSPGFILSLLRPDPHRRIDVSAPGTLSWGARFAVACFRREQRATIARAKFELAHRSRALLRGPELQPHLEGVSFADGHVAIAETDAQLAAGVKEAAQLAAWCPSHRYEVLETQEAVLEREPALKASKRRIVGGLFFPDDMRADCSVVTKRLVQAAEETYGLETRYGAAWTAPSNDDDDDVHILTMGPFTPNAPILPMKGHSLTFKPTGRSQLQLRYVVSHLGNYLCFTPGVGGSEMVRATFGTDFVGRDLTIDQDRLAFVRAHLGVFFDESPEVDGREWSGLRPSTPDDAPLIGRINDRLYINAGHGTLGWTLGVASGERLANHVMTGTTDAVVDPVFDPHRFFF